MTKPNEPTKNAPSRGQLYCFGGAGLLLVIYLLSNQLRGGTNKTHESNSSGESQQEETELSRSGESYLKLLSAMVKTLNDSAPVGGGFKWKVSGTNKDGIAEIRLQHNEYLGGANAGIEPRVMRNRIMYQVLLFLNAFHKEEPLKTLSAIQFEVVTPVQDNYGVKSLRKIAGITVDRKALDEKLGDALELEYSLGRRSLLDWNLYLGR